MACVLYKDGETLLCEPADMEREIAAGWSVKNPENSVTEIVHEETEEESDSEQTEEESEKKKKLLGIF